MKDRRFWRRLSGRGFHVRSCARSWLIITICRIYWKRLLKVWIRVWCINFIERILVFCTMRKCRFVIGSTERWCLRRSKRFVMRMWLRDDRILCSRFKRFVMICRMSWKRRFPSVWRRISSRKQVGWAVNLRILIWLKKIWSDERYE